jgi:hypothetical protein
MQEKIMALRRQGVTVLPGVARARNLPSLRHEGGNFPGGQFLTRIAKFQKKLRGNFLQISKVIG